MKVIRSKQRKSGRAARPGRLKTVRYPAHVTREEDFSVEVPNMGLGRVFGVVLIMHIVAVGGILAFKWIENDAANASESLRGTSVAAPEQTQIPEKANTATKSKSVIADDPNMPGFKKYMVMQGDELVDIARRFNTSVADIESRNRLKTGAPLTPGQWLIVRDRSDDTANDGRPKSLHDVLASASTPPEKPVAGREARESKPKDVIGNQPVEKKSSAPIKAQPITEPVAEPAAEVTEMARAEAVTRLRGIPETGKEPAAFAIRAMPIEDPAPSEAAPAPPAPAPSEAIPQPQPPISAGTHTVRSGETPYGIARQYGVDLQALLNVNGITDPHRVQIGQKLTIPR